MVERNRPYDTFGWGVVFSDQTLGNLRAADPQTARPDPRRLQPLGRHRGQHSGPHDALGRPRLLRHRPQAPAQHPAGPLRGARRRAGVRDRRAGRQPVPRRRPDHRQRRPEQPHPHQATPPPTSPTSTCATAASSGSARSKLFDAFTFAFEETEQGWFQAHAYRSTTTPRPSSSRRPRRSGAPPASTTWSKEDGIAFCEKLFAKYLDGHALMTNASAPARLGAVDPLPARGLRDTGCTTTAARRWC